MSDQEIQEQREKVIFDTKEAFRKTKIEDEGEDPAKDPKVQPDEDEPFESSTNPVGRPPEGTKYGTQDHVRGADPTGNDTRIRDVKNRDRSRKPNFKGGSPLAREIANSMNLFDKDKKILKEESDMLDESNLIDKDLT